MGKFASKLKPRNAENEEEKEIRKYEKHLENNPYGYGLQDTNTEDLRHIKWWQRLIFDLRFRITYALGFAVLLGLAIPILVHFLAYDASDTTIYGSCLIKTDARFQCLINNADNVTREECVSADCCWEENDDLPFKCFHSFPSAYQYTVSSIREEGEDWVELSVRPNHPERMSDLKVWVKWVTQDHLNLQIFNPTHYPERQMTEGRVSDKPRWMRKNSTIINYGDENNYFFIQVIRTNEDETVNETILDTRLGPVYAGENGGFITFSTTLPTPYFYGLTGGEGITSKGTLTYGVMNGYHNAELPFYMVLEDSNSWHGVLVNTALPFVTQVLQAPAISFHLEGSKADVDLQIFLGPTQSDTLMQMHSFLSENVGDPTLPLPYIPPYWGLGLHLCRKVGNATTALKDIQELNQINNNTGETRIPYDSDCIDADLRHPFAIDYTNFPTGSIQTIVELLQTNLTKKIVLGQKVAIPWENETQFQNPEIDEFILKDGMNVSRPFVGMIDNLTVIYMDVFHPNIFENLDLWGFDFGNISFDGLILLDNFPRNEAIDSGCRKPGSFLQKLLQATNVSSGEEGGQTNPWGSLCPEITHTMSVGESRDERVHLELHNAHGLQTQKKFRQVLSSLNHSLSPSSFLFSSSSSWTESLYFGATNGMEVPFSWVGLRNSLSHILSSFILSPVMGTSVCGSLLPNEDFVFDNNLCLRWYQLALLLPHAFHNYAYGNVSRGPLEFPRRYQDYLKDAIRLRYSYAPYYYTLMINYQRTFTPPIQPMSYRFYDERRSDRATLFKLVDQFMIGEAILAAPIVKPDLNRETFFPSGVWYDSDGFQAWNETTKSGFRTVTGHLTQTPLFLRGGHIIPILENPRGNSILETRSRDQNYTIMVPLLLPNNECRGQFYVDNGQDGNVTEISFHATTFQTTQTIDVNITIVVENRPCPSESPLESTRFDHIKLLGYPIRFNEITATYEEKPTAELLTKPGEEMDYLSIRNIGMDWCTSAEAHINIHATQIESQKS